MTVDPNKIKEWEKARDRFLKFDPIIRALVQRERPADSRDLLKLATKQTGYAGVTTRYPAFTAWMFGFDPEQKRPLTVNINSFRFQRRLHEQQVLAALSDIAGRQTGGALFDEIDRLGKVLYIDPYWSFGGTDFKNGNAFFVASGLNATTSPFGKPDKDGRTDIMIKFTGTLWGAPHFDTKTQITTGTFGATGPGSKPDEVLFHEMVHATRAMSYGTFDDATKIEPAGYKNKEEYIAAVVSNIFLAEKAPDKRHPDLRMDVSAFDKLPYPDKFVDNFQHINISPRQLLKEMFNGKQRRFYVALGSIPQAKAWWNPARVVGQEMGLVP